MYKELLCRLRLRNNTSAWASGGPAGGGRVATCLRRCGTLPQHGPPRRVELPHRRCCVCDQPFLYKHFFLKAVAYRRTQRTAHRAGRCTNFPFSPAAKPGEPPCCVADFVVNSEPPPGHVPQFVCVYGANKKKQRERGRNSKNQTITKNSSIYSSCCC
jgi:hypothetical protein